MTLTRILLVALLCFLALLSFSSATQTNRSMAGMEERKEPESLHNGASDAAKMYGVRSLKHTDKDVFQAFIRKEVQRNGEFEVYYKDRQAWTGELTEEEAAKINEQPWVWICAPIDLGMITQRQGAWEERADRPRPFATLKPTPLPTSPSQLSLLSLKPGKPLTKDSEYTSVGDSGRGSTIFIIGSGYGAKHTEFTHRVSDHKIEHWQAKDSETGGTQYPDMADYHGNQESCHQYIEGHWSYGICYSGHETQVGSVAAGATIGVAKHADLFFVKDCGERVEAGGHKTPRFTWSALEAAFEEIIRQLKSNRARYEKRSVISYSTGFIMKKGVTDKWEKVFQDYIPEFQKIGVLYVHPAGNDALKKYQDWDQYGSTDINVPDNLATEDNNIVTVGGVFADGRLSPDSTPVRPGGRGFISCFAQDRDIWGAQNNPEATNHLVKKMGTSFAAPAIAGMIATWLTLFASKEWECEFPKDMTPEAHALKVKKLLIKNAYQRTERPQILGGVAQYPLPDEVKVAFNGAGQILST